MMKLIHRLHQIFPQFVSNIFDWIVTTTVVGTGAILISKISIVPAILVLIASMMAVFFILHTNAQSAAILSKFKNSNWIKPEYVGPHNWNMDALELGFYWAMIGCLVAVIVPPAKFYPIVTLLLSFSVTSFIYGTVHRCRMDMRKRRDQADKN